MQPFNLENYYQHAFTGIERGDASIIPFIKSHRHIILWGASFQGNAIGKKLLELGVNVECYWDIRSEEIKECNGIKVIHPYTSEDAENCLIIICIGNRVIHDTLIKTMRQHGYTNFIHGDYLYMGLLCPFTKQTGINAKRCSQTMECRQVYCHRINGILSSKVNSTDPLTLPSITLVINQTCVLKCKYCTSYMNEYKGSERKNFDLQRICSDIDAFFAAVDLVGTITVMGGEPFMHPDLSDIISHLCTKQNFGLISIATNGVWPIEKRQCEALYDPRVNVSFSNYTMSITEKQKELFYKNIDIIKKYDICHTVGLFSPEWITPSFLYNQHLDEEKKCKLKSKCTHWHQIKNGKVHPCDFATSIYSLGIADYPTDYVDLTRDISSSELKKELKEYIARDYYESCGHHSNTSHMTAKAAEQGYMDFKKPLTLSN